MFDTKIWAMKEVSLIAIDFNDEKNHSNLHVNAANVKQMLFNVKKYIRQGIHLVEDPKGTALFEVTAEVLQGLIAAFDDYESGKEEAWR